MEVLASTFQNATWFVIRAHFGDIDKVKVQGYMQIIGRLAFLIVVLQHAKHSISEK